MGARSLLVAAVLLATRGMIVAAAGHLLPRTVGIFGFQLTFWLIWRAGLASYLRQADVIALAASCDWPRASRPARTISALLAAAPHGPPARPPRSSQALQWHRPAR
jgi:hypothetical protein